MNTIQKLACFLGLIFSTVSVFSNAGLISTTTNGGNNFVPFGGTVTQYQTLYSGDMFGGGVVEITSLAFFHNGAGDGFIEGDFQISLSASSYSSMVTPAVTNVSYNEALAADTVAFSQLSDITVIDGRIQFDGSFLFDSSYNLIIDIVNTNADKNSDWDRFKTAHNSDEFALGRRFTYLSNGGGSAESNSSGSEVAVQFTFNAIAVPESSTLPLLGLGVMTLLFGRLRRK